MINIFIKLISISLISSKSITHTNNMPVVTRSAYNVRRNAMNNMRIVSENCRLEQMCAICHDGIHGSDVFHLPCGHTFHKTCLINQLRHGREWATKCAVCRAEHREALLENNETSQYVTNQSNLDVVFTMMVPIGGHNGEGGEQPPFWGIWASNEGDDNQPINPALLFSLINNQMEQAQDEPGIDPEASEASSIAEPMVNENVLNMDEESDMGEIDYGDEEDEFDDDSEGYNFAPQTWTGPYYHMEYPAQLMMTEDSESTDNSQSETESNTFAI